MTRRAAREHIFRIVFGAEFLDGHEASDAPNRLADSYAYLPLCEDAEELPDELAKEEPTPKEEAYIRQKSTAVISRIGELDDRLNERARGWKTSRMAKVDLAILRLALYEILWEEEIPYKVSVNEAVELAKKYGTKDSPSFVNGILALFDEYDQKSESL